MIVVCRMRTEPANPRPRRAAHPGGAVQARGHALPEALCGKRGLPRAHRAIARLTNMRASTGKDLDEVRLFQTKLSQLFRGKSSGLERGSWKGAGHGCSPAPSPGGCCADTNCAVGRGRAAGSAANNPPSRGRLRHPRLPHRTSITHPTCRIFDGHNCRILHGRQQRVLDKMQRPGRPKKRIIRGKSVEALAHLIETRSLQPTVARTGSSGGG